MPLIQNKFFTLFPPIYILLFSPNDCAGTEKEEQDNEIPYKEIAVQQLSKNDTPKIPGY